MITDKQSLLLPVLVVIQMKGWHSVAFKSMETKPPSNDRNIQGSIIPRLFKKSFVGELNRSLTSCPFVRTLQWLH